MGGRFPPLHPAIRRHGPRVLGIVIVVALFAVVLPRIADYGAVWGIVKSLSRSDVVILLAVAILNVLTFGPPWMAALPGLSFRNALTVSLASTAISNVAPGGDAVGLAMTFAMLRGWGFDKARTTLALVVFTVWNQLVNVAFPIVAIVAAVRRGPSATGSCRWPRRSAPSILVTALVAFYIALRSESGARWVGEHAQQAHQLGAAAGAAQAEARRRPMPLVQFRINSLDLLRRRWLALTLTTLAGHLTGLARARRVAAGGRRRARRGLAGRVVRRVVAGATADGRSRSRPAGSASSSSG